MSPNKGASIGSALTKVGQPAEFAARKLLTKAPAVLPKIATKAAPVIARGATEGAAYGFGTGIAQGKSTGEAVKQAGTDALFGVALDPLIVLGIPALGSKLRSGVQRAIGKYKGVKVDTDTIAKDVAKDIGVDWAYMNESQRAAIRRVVQNMQPEPVRSGRLLPSVKGEGQGFFMRDMTPIPEVSLNKSTPPPLNFKQTIEVPKVYDKHAFTGETRPMLKLDRLITNNVERAKPEIEPLSMKSQIAFKKGKKSLSDRMGEIYRALVTNQANIEKLGKELKTDANFNPAVMSTIAKNSGGTASYIIDDSLVDMGGTKIGESLRKTISVPKEQEEAFQEYLLHKHNISRMKQGKPVFGNDMGENESMAAIAKFERENPGFKEQAANFDKWWKTFSNEWAVKSGLVSKELMERLEQMYEHYVPTFRETTGQANSRINTFGRMSPAKVVQSAVGSDKKLIKPFESIPMQVNKIVKAARQNEVYQGILEAVRKDPEKMRPWAELTKKALKQEEEMTKNILNKGIDGIAEQFEEALKSDPIKGYTLTVMEKGRPVTLRINEGLYRDLMEFKKVPEGELGMFAKYFRMLVTDPFKALITGYNPFFALRNILRDVPTAYIQGTEDSLFGFLKNIKQATKDIKSGSAMYQEFKALGGHGGNFFNVEKGLVPPGALRKIGDKISAFNNLTETVPRYAEYLGTLKREGITYAGKMQGIKNAAEVTVDFSRHGNLTKAADTFVPYLNPAVQGIDKFARSMKRPANVVKALKIVTAPTAGLYALNQAVAKKEYDQLDNRTKDTYFVIPDGNGKFIKIAKTREAGVLFGALFERLARLAEGQEKSFKGFGNTVSTNFFVQNPLTEHVAAPLVWNLPRNKDFANRTIVPQSMLYDKRSPRYQYDERTSEIAKKIGDAFNLSPKQIDYLIKSYLGVIGNIVQPATTKGVNTAEVLSRQFTADPLYNNEILGNFYEKLDDLQRRATDRNITEDIPSRIVTPEEREKNRLQKISTEISKMQKQKLKAQGDGNTEEVDRIQQKILDTARRAIRQGK
ncbi:MAG: LPD38 domain-containing protein [Peptococcia bacterium]